jgi:hypothetical protein
MTMTRVPESSPVSPLHSPLPAPPGANRSGGTDSRLEIDASRARQTERPATPFRNVLSRGASFLLAGAEVATHVVAGPILAAAVHDARVGTAAAIAGPGTPVPGAIAAVGLAATGGTVAGGGPGGAGGGGGDAANVQALVQDGQASNLQLLALQQQVQQENQRFSTLSNVMRAKHDTAKAAVSNIRA